MTQANATKAAAMHAWSSLLPLPSEHVVAIIEQLHSDEQRLWAIQIPEHVEPWTPQWHQSFNFPSKEMPHEPC